MLAIIKPIVNQVFSHIKRIRSKVGNEFKMISINKISINRSNLGTFLGKKFLNNEGRNIFGEQSGVYEISCRDCEAI